MAVESCKISSSDCNLSWEVLKNGSSKDLFYIATVMVKKSNLKRQ